MECKNKTKTGIGWLISLSLVAIMVAMVGVLCIRGIQSSWHKRAEYRSILRDSDQVLIVQVVQKGDDIFVLNKGTRQLVFEFNRLKPADALDYQVFDGLLDEAKALAEK